LTLKQVRRTLVWLRTGASRRIRATRVAVALLACALASLTLAAGQARPTDSATVTITMLRQIVNQPADKAVIANFERSYPNIKVDMTYIPTTDALWQLEVAELDAGNAPELLTTSLGCGAQVGICELAKAGDLTPMVNAAWTKWSLPSVTAESKYGPVLWAWEPGVTQFGIFTNNSLFAKLGVRIPQTFAQLLTVCRQARAAGTTAVLLSGRFVPQLALDFAANTVYRTDKKWTGKLKAGAVTFDGSAGWHKALQQIISMNDAGCFEPGVAGVQPATATSLFAQGQALMYAVTSVSKGTIDTAIDTAGTSFTYSFRLFPAATSAKTTSVLVTLGPGFSINAHASRTARAAARTFIDFYARPKQSALAARLAGNLTQSEFLHGQLPRFMSPSFKTAFAAQNYVVGPSNKWRNPDVLTALQDDGVGLITGQETVDGVLKAMDAAWKKGPP
jgi:raffinose/stachyose/melibiose transport system substrate-binding protein